MLKGRRVGRDTLQLEKGFVGAVGVRRQKDPVGLYFSGKLLLHLSVIGFTDGLQPEIGRAVEAQLWEIDFAFIADQKRLVADQQRQHEGDQVECQNSQKRVVASLEALKLAPTLAEDGQGRGLDLVHY
jgi:hypothetical protein